jgi:hypothetical protein
LEVVTTKPLVAQWQATTSGRKPAPRGVIITYVDSTPNWRKYVHRSFIPISDQLLAEDDETVKKKFEASFCSLPVRRLRPPTVLDDLLALLPLVAARRVVQKLRLNQGKDPFNSLKEKDWLDQAKRIGDLKRYARIESKTLF